MEANDMKAMREALENIVGYAETARFRTEDVHILSFLGEIEGWARSALSAPARNCDLYDTQPTMSMAYEAYRKAAMRSYGNGLTGAVPMVKQKPMTYDEWLLAPAAERKGEGDGR